MRTSQRSQCAVGTPYQSEITVTPAYHPEFGYLCPSSRVRQRIRAAMISAGVGMLVGACVVLSLMDRRFADGQQSERSTVGRDGRDWTAATKVAVSGNQESLVAIQDDTSTPAAQGACDDKGVAFLNPNCRPVKKRKAHALRSSSARLATIEIGTELERRASAGIDGKSIQGGGLSSAAEELRQSTAALDRAAASAIKSARHARIRQRSGGPKGEGSSAFAYAFPYAQSVRHDDTYRDEHNWRWPH